MSRLPAFAIAGKRKPSRVSWNTVMTIVSRSTIAIAVLCGLLVASPAAAHDSPTLAGGFAAGFAHPFAGFDHLLAMIAVGIWGAFLGRPLVVLLPVVFPMMMAVGGALGMIGAPMPPVEVGIALSVIMLGVAIAAAWRAPVWLAVIIVAVFAVFHGYAHGSEVPSIADPTAYSLGFVLATGALHVAGIALGSIVRLPYGAAAVRGIGAVVAVVGLWFLTNALGAAS